MGCPPCEIPENRIYLAIESQGLPLAGPPVKHEFPLLLDSKILKLNTRPQVVVLAAGGLDHWAYVVANYSSSSSVTAATSEIIDLLNSCMTEEDQAFGLVCGYEHGKPKCFRVNRFRNKQQTESPIEEQLAKPLGLGDYGEAAKGDALLAIKNNERPRHPLVALVETIDCYLPRPNVRGPIHSLIIPHIK